MEVEDNDSYGSKHLYLGSDHLKYPNCDEVEQIKQRFLKVGLKLGCQVMWSGVPREWAQRWADRNDMQTLTTVMGPLMNTCHTAYQKNQKSREEWSVCVKGASSFFASHVPKGYVVTVLTRPPSHCSSLNAFGYFRSAAVSARPYIQLGRSPKLF